MGDEEVFAEKKIEFACGKDSILAIVVHRMDNHEQIGREEVALFGRLLLHFGSG